MISIKNQTPSVYYDASRDFQVLGHLFEVVLNYVKTNADMLYLLPDGIKTDTRATELLAMTLGFKPKRNYDKDQLAALVSIFPQLLKIKGTIQAIELAGNALVKAAGVNGVFDCDLENHVLTVKIPQELADITLFMDLLPYILPFGIRVSIVRTTVITKTVPLELGATSIVRKALPALDSSGRHPLGLVNISDDMTKIISPYQGAAFINNDGSIRAAGLLGATPIIEFDPSGSSSVLNLQPDTSQDEEEIN